MRTFLDKHRGRITYRKIAQLSGISEQTIYNWKIGSQPRVINFIEICRALSALIDVQYDELVKDGLWHIEQGYE